MTAPRRRASRIATLCAVVALSPLVAVQSNAEDSPHLDHVVPVDARRSNVHVYSAAMNRIIELQVIRPADASAPRPTLYLLNGAEDGVQPDGTKVTWESETDLVPFMADKNVNVVTIVDGKYSYYTDWVADDPVLGRNKWTTFLTRELPPIIDSMFSTSGRNAIAGVSMSATSALALAAAAPGLYQSVGSFSGCPETSTDPGRRVLQATVLSGQGNPFNIWGPDDAKEWVTNDPTTDTNLERLRNTNLFVTVGNGQEGPHEFEEGLALDERARRDIYGVPLESTAAGCTRELESRLNRLGIAATFQYRPFGTHSWPYWQDDLHAAWPSFANSLGI